LAALRLLLGGVDLVTSVLSRSCDRGSFFTLPLKWLIAATTTNTATTIDCVAI
jgi:hypothetical protein